MNLSRVTRLLRLLQRLQSGNGDNADGLASACGVSRRTIFRDIETLKAAGVPVEFDKQQSRYSIASAFFLPPTNLTAAEALSIIALASQLGRDDKLPFFGPARSAALKLESSLPPALRDELRTLTRSIQFRLPSVDPLQGQLHVYRQIVEAISARRVLRMQYRSLTEWETIRTKLRPYRLMFNRHSWYVIGRSSLHKEPRTFNLSRIVSLAQLNEKYAMPRGFSIERHLGNAWNIIPEPGKDFNVTVRFGPLVAQNVAEVVWHKTQELQLLDDGRLDFHVRVSGLNEIVWWILGYGDHAEVLRPAKLRKLVARRAANMAAIYGDDGKV